METPYNIIGDSLARRFALYLDGSHDTGLHANYQATNLEMKFQWAPFAKDILGKLDNSAQNIVMIGIHDVYDTPVLPNETIRLICSHDNVLWRIAPKPWCQRPKRTPYTMHTILARLQVFNKRVKEYCGERAVEVDTLDDHGDSCEHYGDLYHENEMWMLL